MNVTMGPISHPEQWVEKFSFYAFDIPVPGTAPLQLQHCIRSIHTTAAGINRHRLTTQDPIIPWQFRFTLFIFPVSLDECHIDHNESNMNNHNDANPPHLITPHW